jgi:hypothetical protein
MHGDTARARQVHDTTSGELKMKVVGCTCRCSHIQPEEALACCSRYNNQDRLSVIRSLKREPVRVFVITSHVLIESFIVEKGDDVVDGYRAGA